MTALLADSYQENAINPANKEIFFDPVKELPIVRAYARNRECTDTTFPPRCDANLFFGFFFDGTDNNLKRDRERHTHSNVARLYSAFPGGKDRHGSEAWTDFKTKYRNSFFRTYVPGVGTPFPEVGDSGAGFSLKEDRPKGLGFCYKGENRIIWALAEAMNNIHRYYTDLPLISDEEFKSTLNKLPLPSLQDALIAPDRLDEESRYREMRALKNAFSGALQKLHASLQNFLPIGPGKSKDKGQVIQIYASMFGFSRGATKARAFCNWFVWLCKLDADISGRAGLSLGTIPVTIDFVGLFDTVASVGLPASSLIADGHQAWADADASLAIPQEPAQCLHLVSGHEVRRSFPLDSIMMKGKLPANCKEIVFPGVHSDIGGGYAPMEHGRGKDPEGADMISRIALAVMYRAARVAGVPLKLEEAPESVKRGFRVDPRVIQAFNAYIDECRRDDKRASAPLHDGTAAQVLYSMAQEDAG